MAGTHSAWLSWIAPAAGPVTLDTFGSDFDTVLAVYTNNPPTVPNLNTLVPVISNDDATNGSFQSQLTFDAVAGAAYQIAVDGWDQTESGRITFHLSQPNLNPVILTQPQSQVVNQSANVTFSVSATGPGPLSYQWRFNGDIPGATRTNYSQANVQPANQGLYTVAVINGNGPSSSLPAALTVRVAPTITAQPQSLVADPGGDATFSVAVSGTAPFTYQWRFNGVNLGGATEPTYTRVNVQPTHAGSYSVVVANGAGAVTSQGADLTVRPKIVSARMTPEGVMLTLQGTPGRSYAVEMQPGLGEGGAWQTLGTVSNATVESQFLDTTLNGAPQRVYRLRLLP